MEIGLLSSMQLAQSQDLKRFLSAAHKMNIRMSVYSPTNFLIQIRNRQVCILDQDMKTITTKGFINWVPFPKGEEINLACTLQNIPFINSVNAVCTARNKVLTSLAFYRAGIPQPDTTYLHKNQKAEISQYLLDIPCVFKPKTGTHGRYSYKFNHQKDLLRFIGQCRKNTELYLQKFVPNDGWDLRIVVVGRHVLGAIKKTARQGEWRTHIEHGGSAETYIVDKELEQLAIAAADCLNLEIAGLDIMIDKNNGYKVLEANSVPGLTIFEKTTGISIASEIINYMVELVRQV